MAYRGPSRPAVQAERWRVAGRRERGTNKRVQVEWMGSRKKLGEAWVSGDFFRSLFQSFPLAHLSAFP